MIKRDEVAIRTSCLNKSADNEPIFVLRAHDSIASDVVREWVILYQMKKTANGRRMDLREELKCAEAIVLADLMDSWRIEQSVKSDEGGEKAQEA